MCSSWEGGAGANACFVLEPEELHTALTTLPADGPPIGRDVRIERWLEMNDGISESEALAFFTDRGFYDLSKETIRRPAQVTRLGSVPSWVQSPHDGPGDGWRFIGQLDCYYSFYTRPRNYVGLSPDLKRQFGRTHVGEGPNFGDCGIGYIFLRNGMSVPEGWFFWQCA
jgi:hypothetical protein